MFKTRISKFHKYLPVLALTMCIGLIGCAAPVSTPLTSSLLPVTGADGSFQVHEYALVEESNDNPNHTSFAQRVPPVVAAQRAGWPFGSSGDTVKGQNQALAPFGYRLAPNPAPPFSGFALYHNTDLVKRDIARFWPVSIKGTNGIGSDFILSFETMQGERLEANVSGIHPWSEGDLSVGRQVYQNQPLAYAGNIGSEAAINVEDEPAHNIPSGSFGSQNIAGQPFYLYTRGGQVHLNYAGRDLAYTYDQVVHGNTAGLTIFNPGGAGQIAWFYALRDGLWYYVEVGIFR